MQTLETEVSAPVAREAWSIKSLADLYDCSTKTIRRAILAGHLDTFKIGKSAVRVTDESRRRWAASLREQAAARVSAAFLSPKRKSAPNPDEVERA